MNDAASPLSVDFFFDFASPYGYLAAMQIDELAARHGRHVDWKPILLGVVFKQTGGAPLTEIPLKGDYARLDFERSARLAGIPFKLPSRFPLPTQLAARAMLWVRERHDEPSAVAFAKRVYQAVFVDDVDVTQPEAVLAVGAELGLDVEGMKTGMNGEPARTALRAGVAEAIERGVFGSPFFIVDGEPFWGFDRLQQLEITLAQPAAEATDKGGSADRRVGYRRMVDEATQRIRRYSVDEARAKLADPKVQFVDLRDPRELEREGVMPGAFHAPRGMLEFWIDPESPYHKPTFAEDKEFVFFCAGGLRSALATETAQRMGLRVADVDGGFAAWKASGAPVADKLKKAV